MSENDRRIGRSRARAALQSVQARRGTGYHWQVTKSPEYKTTINRTSKRTKNLISKTLPDEIFKHMFQPWEFDGSDLKTSRIAGSRHFHLFGWAAKLLKYAIITMIFCDFQLKLSVTLDF